MAHVLGVSSAAVCIRFKHKHFADRVRAARKKNTILGHRAWISRRNWRRKLRAQGINPNALTPDNPLWHKCFRYPRGYFVDLVAGHLRVKFPGETIGTIERIEEIVRRAGQVADALIPADADRR